MVKKYQCLSFQLSSPPATEGIIGAGHSKLEQIFECTKDINKL